MKTNSPKQYSLVFFLMLVIGFLSLQISCSSDETSEEVMAVEEEIEAEIEEEVSEVEEEVAQPCSNVSDFIFNEKEGLVTVEFEEAEFSEDWKLKPDGTNVSGAGYMVWEGAQHLGEPGNGKARFMIKIENAGTYQFLWKSAVKIGDNGTDHNDTWLRFNDADDFYAKNGTSIVYPKDTGKTPNPEGATKDGWFKIYRSGSNLDFKWQASTFDNNGHDVFVVFENPGTYLMEVSARSSGHGIDKFVLFNTSRTKAEAIADSNELSKVTCN